MKIIKAYYLSGVLLSLAFFVFHSPAASASDRVFFCETIKATELLGRNFLQEKQKSYYGNKFKMLVTPQKVQFTENLFFWDEPLETKQDEFYTYNLSIYENGFLWTSTPPVGDDGPISTVIVFQLDKGILTSSQTSVSLHFDFGPDTTFAQAKCEEFN